MYQLQDDDSIGAHMKVDHSDEILACDFCSHVFTDKNEYDCHLREWHNFVDGATQEGEGSQGAEVDHKNLIMLNLRGKKARLKPVTCSICGKDFQYKYMLKKHLGSHAKTDEALMCPEPGCGKSFPIEKYLKLHIATHTERRFKCADCDRSYKEFRILKWHIKKEHLKADPPYKCNYCTYTGWYSEQYKRHLRVYHENEIQMAQKNVKK
uniref:C2H2-type domain-containing protein n=1 Tax=Phlebotomus papatasi TaxID=29031 RepID=A0A1B0DDR2_PHLPP